MNNSNVNDNKAGSGNPKQAPNKGPYNKPTGHGPQQGNQNQPKWPNNKDRR
jgi:hypothetical protein